MIKMKKLGEQMKWSAMVDKGRSCGDVITKFSLVFLTNCASLECFAALKVSY